MRKNKNTKLAFPSQAETPNPGKLGGLWGTLSHAVNNIIGLVLLILLLSDIVYTFLVYPIVIGMWPELASLGMPTPAEIWNLSIPLMATSFGILIGKYSR